MLALALTLTFAPVVAAAPATLEVDHARGVALAGDVVVAAQGGGACTFGGVPAGTHTLTNATGRVTLYEENATRLMVIGRNFTAGEGVQRTDWRVENATVTFTTIEEDFHYCARTDADRGRVLARGPVDAKGAVVRVPRDTQDSYGVQWGGNVERVHVEWKEGWPFVGNDPFIGGTDPHGFPTFGDVRVGFAGETYAHFEGGNVTFTDVDGHTHAYRLSPTTREEYTRAPERTSASDDVWRWLVFEGTLGDASLPVGRYWGVAGPTVTWHVDGTAQWVRATGTYDVGEGPVRFKDARVAGAGTLALTLADAPAAAPAPAVGDPFTARGDWERLSVNGRAIAFPSSAAAVATAGVLALLATLLFEAPREALVRVVGAFYSRIRPGDALSHPRRREILDAAREEPGIHLRALHRRVGGGWGGFREHVKRLTDAGFLRLDKTAGYTAVHPADAVPADADAPLRVPTEVAQRVLDTLTETDAPLSVPDLRERVGVSDQLLRYHLKRLDAQGLVALEWDADGRRVVRPLPASPAARTRD